MPVYLFVMFVGMGIYKLAHKLAHMSCNFSGLRVWLEEVPTEAILAVNADLIQAE